MTQRRPSKPVRPRTPPGFVIVVTEGSRWVFWETEHRYSRSPRTETSRENPAWGGPEAGPLQDHVWHDFDTWSVIDAPFGPRLRIELPDGNRIRAPHPSLPIGARHSCTRCDGDTAASDA